MLLFHTGLIAPKTTKNTQGVQAMNLKKGQRLLKAQLLATRICAAILAVLTGALILWARQMFTMVQRLDSALGQTDLAAVSRNLEQLDLAGMNEALGRLSQLDIDKLNSALDSLGEAAGQMNEAGDAISRFANGLAELFGGAQ